MIRATCTKGAISLSVGAALRAVGEAGGAKTQVAW